MPLDFASMLLQPTKATPWNLSPDGSSGAREQLKLAREKFEWEKKHADEQARLDREKQAAQMAQARLEAEATKAAKLQEDRLKVYGEFTKANGEGNFEGARAMVPMMSALGMGVELEGEVDGLPRYRVDMDAAAAQKEEDARLAQTSPYGGDEPPAGSMGSMEEGVGAEPTGETAEQSLRRLGAMGLGGETGSLQPPLGIRSSGEVDPVTGLTVGERVQNAIDDESGEPLRGPDEPDYTGGVPKNVIDTGAMADATLKRLDPSLKAAAAAFPDAQTATAAEGIRQGLRSSGLPFEKQAGLFDKATSAAATQRNAQINAQAQADRFRETRDDLTEKDKAAMRETGRKGADELAQRNDIPGGVKALRTADEIDDLLEDTGPGSKENDTMIAGALMSIQDVKGIPSDRDLAMAFGMDKASTITQVLDYIGTKWQGGFQPDQRAAIKSFIERVRKSQKEKLTTYLDSTDTISDYNEHEQAGYKGRAKRAVPGYIYNEWLDTHKQRDEGSAGDKGKSGGGEDFDRALDDEAKKAGYDPTKIRAVIRHESSGGQGDAKSVAGAAGAFQLMGDRAQEVGTSSEELLAMPAAQQVPYGIKYLKNTGLKGDAPPRDYALAFAAPAYIGKSDDTVIKQYKKGTKRGDTTREQNPGWVPKGGGDITVGSILDFYGLRGETSKQPNESPALRLQKERAGTTSALPPPKSVLDQEVADLARKAGK